MRQKVIHGGEIDVVTPEEAQSLFKVELRNAGRVFDRIRATSTISLNAAGAGQEEVYTVPLGFEFVLRRVFINLPSATDPNTGNVLLNAAGKYVSYLRSGTLISYGQPAYGAAVQVPGVETWGSEQGPYLRNGETFEVAAAGLTASVGLTVFIQGILYRRDNEEA